MNPRLPLHDTRDEEQAALWAARLEGGSLRPADRDTLEAWLTESSSHRALLAEYCQFSADLEAQLPGFVARGSVAMPVAKPTRRRFLRVGVFGGVAFATAAIAVLLWTGRPATQAQEIATAVAQRQTATLVDGSRVELDARTTLRVDFNRTARRIHLAQGQAFFSVTRDHRRPFVVDTPAGSVRVTGTVFAVRAAAASELEVTVVEGSVLVRPGEAGSAAAENPVALGAGHQLISDGRAVSRQMLNDQELEDALAWRKGVVVFKGVPLEAALARFARHHGCEINVLDGAAAHAVSGRHSLDDLDEFIGALDRVFPVKVTRSGSGTITVAPRSGP